VQGVVAGLLAVLEVGQAQRPGVAWRLELVAAGCAVQAVQAAAGRRG